MANNQRFTKDDFVLENEGIYEDCEFHFIDFSGSDLSKSDCSLSNFTGANLDGANLTGANFRRSRNYAFDVRTTKIKGAKFSFPDVASLLTILGAEVDL